MPVNTYDDLIDASGKRNNVDPRLIKTTIHLESSGNPNVEDSPQGAVGLAQFLPSTAAGLKRPINPRNPSDAIDGMGQYLREGLDATGNSPSGALAFYHGGPDRAQWGPKTAAYVAKGAALYPSMSMTTAAQGQPQPMAQPASKGDMSGADILKAFLGKKAPEDAPDAPAQAPQGDPASGQDILDRFLSKMPAAPAELKATVPGVGGVDDLGRPNLGADVEPAPAGQPGGATTAGIAAAGAVGRIGSAIAQGAQDGAQGAQPILTPEGNSSVVRGLQSAGIYPPDGQPGTMMQRGNRLVMGGIGGVISDGVQGGMNLLNAGVKGVLGGAAQTGTELVSPAFGRALGGLGEATMADLGSRIPAVRDAPINRLAPLAPEAFDRTITGPAGRGDSLVQNPQAQAAISRLPGTPTAPSSPIDPLAIPRAAEPVPVTQGATIRVTPPDGAVPNSVGAAATPSENLPPMTQDARNANLQKSVLQSAEDRAGHMMEDHTTYVPGVERPLSAREFTPSNSLDHKTMMATDTAYRAEQEKIARDANQTMVDKLAGDAGDANSLAALHDARSEVAPPSQQLFAGEKSVDSAPLIQSIRDLLAGPDGKRDAIRITLNKVLDSLHNADGKPESMPSQIYGARQNITDMLKKASGVGDGASDARASKSILMKLLDDQVDPLINQGAPRFQAYLNDFHEASQPINQQEFLQKYQTGAKKLTNNDGYLQLNKVQKMLDDLFQGNKKPGIDAAKSLTDEHIQNIINVRNELAANGLRDRLAKVAGSDTTQLQNRAGVLGSGPIGAAVRGMGEVALHGALAATTGGIGNIVYANGIKPALQARRSAISANQLAIRKSELLQTQPPINKLMN